MDMAQLTDDEVLVVARATSIHRVSLRRKLGRLAPGHPDYSRTLVEIETAQQALSKLNVDDLNRLTADH